MEGSIPGPWGSQSLVSPSHDGFWGEGPILTSHPDLCHSHPCGSHRGGVEVGVTQEVVSQAGLWHSPTAPGPDLRTEQGKLSWHAWRAPGLHQLSDCWRFSPAQVQWVPQGSQTLCAITMWHFHPLRVLKTWLRTPLCPPFPLWASSSGPSQHPQEHPHPRPPEPPTHESPPVPDPSQRSSTVKESPPASTDPSTPSPGDPRCPSRSEKHILATEIGYLK